MTKQKRWKHAKRFTQRLSISKIVLYFMKQIRLDLNCSENSGRQFHYSVATSRYFVDIVFATSRDNVVFTNVLSTCILRVRNIVFSFRTHYCRSDRWESRRKEETSTYSSAVSEKRESFRNDETNWNRQMFAEWRKQFLRNFSESWSRQQHPLEMWKGEGTWEWCRREHSARNG